MFLNTVCFHFYITFLMSTALFFFAMDCFKENLLQQGDDPVWSSPCCSRFFNLRFPVCIFRTPCSLPHAPCYFTSTRLNGSISP